MSFAIVTIHNESYAELAGMTFDKNKIPYCEKHSYKLFAKTSNFSEGTKVYFDKLRHCLEVLEQNPDLKWIWWLDCDAVITNFNKKIEEFCDNNFICVLTCDNNSPNNGSFFLKNCDKSKQFLRDVLSVEDSFLDFNTFYKGCPWDNAAWNKIYDNSPEYQTLFKIQRQRDFNSYSYISDYHRLTNRDMAMTGELNQWQPGDFVVHYAGLGLYPEIRDMLVECMLICIQELNLHVIKN